MDRRAKAGNRLAMLAGAVGGDPTVAGAGLAYLAVTSWRAARGLVGSALSGDVEEMGEWTCKPRGDFIPALRRQRTGETTPHERGSRTFFCE